MVLNMEMAVALLYIKTKKVSASFRGTMPSMEFGNFRSFDDLVISSTIHQTTACLQQQPHLYLPFRYDIGKR
jgi:hypothetical protein